MDVRDVPFIQDRPVTSTEAVKPTETPVQAQSQGATALKDIAFGSLAGVAGKYVEYPFDTVKVRLQSQPDHLPLRYKGPLDCFAQSLRSEGFLGLYRGISAPLVGAAAENASLFFSYRVFQNLLTSTVYNDSTPLSLPALASCGALSGAFTSIVLTPIELVKCKMQVPAQSSVALNTRPGMLTIISSIYKHQGVAGFWRGQMGTLFRETGGSAAWFGSYESVSAFFRARLSRQNTSGNMDTVSGEKIDLPIHQQMLAGAAAGMAYNFAFFPADTIKSRLQTEEIGIAGARPQEGFWSTGKAIWRQHGLRGLYRGCGITVARSAPSSALIFTLYEAMRTNFG
ncbi:Amino-acid transporter arg-13 [Sphaceloma murrayae]|uniref:Amino-acid transporter arg-13 n=1 Tax=Sphaceloma murrayae TaxID=2082308 RepID=A0A2K1QSU6_9PEZI|nr:Amino-acid transporter arg-13 [Sphaceloma murrayae]